MAALDLTTFTIHDTQSILTINSNKIAVGENGHADLTACVYKDFGPGGIKNFEYKFKLRFNPTSINYESWFLGTLPPKNIFVMSNQHSEGSDDKSIYPVIRVTVSPIADFNNILEKPSHYSLSGWSLNKGLPTDHSAFRITKEGDEENQIIDWEFDRCLKEHSDNYNWWWKIKHLENQYDRPMTFVYLYKSQDMTDATLIAAGCTFSDSVGDDEIIKNACEGCPVPVFDGKIYLLNMDGSFCSTVTVKEYAIDDDNISNHIYRDDTTIRTYTPAGIANMGESYIIHDEEQIENNLPYVDHYYTIRRSGETYAWPTNYQEQLIEHQVEKVEISVYTDAERTQLVAQGHVGVTPDETYRYFYPLRLVGNAASKEWQVTGNYEISECDLTIL